jgi:CheY-like chemotaxis protein
VSGSINQITVLVAEDHVQMRNCIVQILQREFCVMGAVGDGDELVHAAMRLEPDVVVSDVLMPRLTGPEAERAVRESGASIPFIFVTSDRGAVNEILANGGQCINKTDLLTNLPPAIRKAAKRTGSGGISGAGPVKCDSLGSSCLLQ